MHKRIMVPIADTATFGETMVTLSQLDDVILYSLVTALMSLASEREYLERLDFGAYGSGQEGAFQC